MNSNQPKSFSNQSSSWEGLAILEPSGSLSWGRDHWTAVVPGLALDSMEDKQVAVYPLSAVFFNHDMICLYMYVYIYIYLFIYLNISIYFCSFSRPGMADWFGGPGSPAATLPWQRLRSGALEACKFVCEKHWNSQRASNSFRGSG